MKHKLHHGAPLLMLVNFLSVFGWGLLTPLYALYAIGLGTTPQEVSLTWGAYTLFAGLLTIALGWFEDKLGDSPSLLVWGYAIKTLGTVFLFMAGSKLDLIIGLGVYAVGTGVVLPLWKAVYSRYAHRGRDASDWGMFHGGNMLLIAFAAMVSGVILGIDGFKGILGLMVVAHALATVLSLRFLRR